MVTRYMERDPQLTFGQTWLCTYWGFMAVAVVTGLALGPVGVLMSFLFGTMLALFITPIAAALWMLVRAIVGETFFTCLPFGAFVGFTLFYLLPPTSKDLPLLAGPILGLIGGLVYWVVAQRLERNP